MKKGSKLGVSEVAAMKKKSELRAMNGLKKKLYELLTLCEIEGFLIISDSDGNQVMTMGEILIQQQSETWAPEDKDQCMKIINRYKENSGFKKSYSGFGRENDSRKDEEDGFKNSSSLDESYPKIPMSLLINCYSPDSVLGMNSTGNSHQIDTVMDATLNQVSPLIEIKLQQYNFCNSDQCFNGCGGGGGGGGGDESCYSATCWDQLNELNDGQQHQMVNNFGKSGCFNGTSGDDKSCNDISWDQPTSLVEVNDDQCFNNLENSECFLLSDGSDGGGSCNIDIASYQNPIIDDHDRMFQMMMYGYSLGYSDGALGNNGFSSTSEETDQFLLSDSSLNPQLMN